MLQLGRTLLLQGNLPEATSVLEQAHTLDPASPTVEEEYRRSVSRVGEALAASGVRVILPVAEEAAGRSTEMVGSNPNNPELSRLLIRSRLEHVVSGRVVGWAFDSGAPSSILVLDAYVDDVFFMKVGCELEREDLKRSFPSLRGGGFEMKVPIGEGEVVVSLRSRGCDIVGSPIQVKLEPFQQHRGLAFAAHHAIARSSLVDKPIFILVAIDDGADNIKDCLDALLEHTTAPAELILLDDATSDKKIVDVLADYRDRAGVRVVRSEAVLGFALSINNGIRLAGTSDIVLLSPQVRVGPRWLEGLKLAALSHPRVATSTACSNAVGPFSVSFPDGVAAAQPSQFPGQFQRSISQTSAVLWPASPAGNSNCSFIKRDAIDDVGLLDEIAFPNGRGAYEDWCFRANRFGWTHVVDDRTYVFHASSTRGVAGAEIGVEQGLRLVEERFSEYSTLARAFAEDRSVATIKYNVARTLSARAISSAGYPDVSILPRVLFCISSRSGGMPLTDRDLLAALMGRYEPWVLTSDGNSIQLHRFAGGDSISDVLVETELLRDPITLTHHWSSEYDEIVARWMTKHAVELLHIRHNAGHSLGLARAAEALGVPTVLAFHDYYSVCPTIKLLDEEGRFCSGQCTTSSGECTPDLWPAAQAPPLKNRWVRIWRSQMAQVVSACSAFVATSEAAKTILKKALVDLPADRFHVIPHGRDVSKFHPPRTSGDRSGPFRILIAGSISVAKGRDIISGILDADSSRRLEIHLLGTIDPHGAYQRESFGELAKAIQAEVGGVFSIWGETDCHTLTELWAAGLPVIGFEFGSVAERLRSSGAGWIVDHQDARKLYEEILRISEDASGLDLKRQAVARWQEGEGVHNTTRAMADRYDGLYTAVLARRRLSARARGHGAMETATQAVLVSRGAI